MTDLVEILRIEIPDVEPVPWPRSRISRSGKLYLPKNYVAFRDLVAMHLRAGYRGAPTPDPIKISLAFYRKSRRHADVDNLAKTVLDAGSGIVWVDDYQIRDLTVGRREGDRRSIEILAWRVSAGEDEVGGVSSSRPTPSRTRGKARSVRAGSS